jgi:hypothetical protein
MQTVQCMLGVGRTGQKEKLNCDTHMANPIRSSEAEMAFGSRGLYNSTPTKLSSMEAVECQQDNLLQVRVGHRDGTAVSHWQSSTLYLE